MLFRVFLSSGRISWGILRLEGLSLKELHEGSVFFIIIFKEMSGVNTDSQARKLLHSDTLVGALKRETPHKDVFHPN